MRKFLVLSSAYFLFEIVIHGIMPMIFPDE
jgi:hypothetical protein